MTAIQRERQKIGKTTILHVHHAFLYISFLTLHDYDMKMPNFRFCGRCEHKTTFFFFSWTSIQSFRIQLQKNCQHLRKELKNLKFEVAQLHLLSDVLLSMLKLLLSSWTTSLFSSTTQGFVCNRSPNMHDVQSIDSEVESS